MHALTDGHGRVLAFRLSGGNVHDDRAFAALLDAVRVPRRGAGRPHTRPGCSPSPPKMNGLTPGYRIYRSGLVPRGMAMLRLIGGARILRLGDRTCSWACTTSLPLVLCWDPP